LQLPPTALIKKCTIHFNLDTDNLQAQLLAERNAEGTWTGCLSSSAVSTAVACCALQLAGTSPHLVEKMRAFLLRTRLADSSWGDSPESPGNPTATLLARLALGLEKPAAPAEFVAKVRAIYGRDLTFSAPILALCAAMGAIPWSHVPRLPYQLALLPRRIFHILRLPVVSYAIPALIAVGLARRASQGKRDDRDTRNKKDAHSEESPLSPFCPFRPFVTKKYLALLDAMQPRDGGYLSAAPLTGFVASCLIAAGHRDSPVVTRALGFLEASVREDGGVPIDSNLEIWLTSLAIKALGHEAFTPAERETLIAWYYQHQRKEIHPFNGAAPGGWAWTTLEGGVPDADDTAAALIALHILGAPYSPEIESALRWLMSLQNFDGGIATFCRGWGHLPFDRSTPDISAHAHRAFTLWQPQSSLPLARICRRIERFLEKTQSPEGSWTPLWFGDQDSPTLEAPVYGTAVVLEHLKVTRAFSSREVSRELKALVTFLRRAFDYLLAAQNPDGGWGGTPGAPTKILITARVVAALARFETNSQAYVRAVSLLAETTPQPEPIGLYFAKLWYSEKLYHSIFTLDALRNVKVS